MKWKKLVTLVKQPRVDERQVLAAVRFENCCQELAARPRAAVSPA